MCVIYDAVTGNTVMPFSSARWAVCQCQLVAMRRKLTLDAGCLLKPANVCTFIYVYSKTSLNQPTMGPTLSGPFREVVSLGS